MKQMSKRRCISVCILIVFLTNLMYFSGDASILNQSVELAKETIEGGTKKSNNSNTSGSKTTAIVNLDEGILQGNKIRNYGNELIATLTEEVKATGLEDARTGIENGIYDAYIIIPNSFSKQVSMINEKPEKATLTYAISTGLELVEREKTLEKVVNIYHTFSSNLSQVYTSSIIKEYHEVQDSADEIMNRDKLEMERLLAINGYDLVEIIEIPEMEEVENNTSKLDLSDNYTVNDKELGNISSAYESFYANGQEDFDIIKSDTKTGKEKENTTKNSIDTASKNVNQIKPESYDDTDDATLEDKAYQKYRDELINDEKDKEGILNTYNSNLENFNKSVVQKSTQYEYVQTQYKALRDALEHAKISSNVENPVEGIDMDLLSDTYEFYLNSQMESMVSIIAGELKRVDELLDQAVSQNSISQNGIPDGIPIYPSGTPLEEYENYVETLLVGIDPTEIKGLYPKTPVTNPTVEINEVEVKKMPLVDTAEVGKKIDNIIKKAKEGRTKRNKQYQAIFENYTGNITTLQSQVTNIDAAFKDQTHIFSLIEENVAKYDLSSYIDDEEIGGYVSKIEKNNEDIEQKVHENTEEYEEYAEDVFNITYKNIETIRKNIEEGQEKSDKKLEEGLEEAKEFRQSSNEKNVSILKAFSQRLSYTRLGELENKEVYNFIAEPILLDNQSDPIVISTMSNTADKSSVSTSDADNKLGIFPNWFFLIAIVAVLFAAGSYIAIKVIRSKNQEDF